MRKISTTAILEFERAELDIILDALDAASCTEDTSNLNHAKPVYGDLSLAIQKELG